ncbi:long-chain fatty acid--CoA ligase [Caldimonas brevitalea]|uniref:Long-chain fatty acid--CoA ligase n=1 Tax=Caldimonas brevitalea TaxID=413882 RepID=A0A0G3BPE3_9BURK|nr:long-chain fatty acid--CoA ligase [Caldimonas brevitalea]AKJ29838.1 long-chain fatty acid--CoA ligase [Caldimonas brevitalea]
MSNRHFAFWPEHVPQHLYVPETHLWRNAEISAMRFPHKPFLVFYDTEVSFGQFAEEAERVAGYLQRECGVGKGDRVLLCMQNSPQFMIAFYGILRADAVVVPVNPMNLTEELAHYVEDSGARVALIAQELSGRFVPLLERGLQTLIVATYSDYLRAATALSVPDFVAAPRTPTEHPRVVSWSDVLERQLAPGPLTGGPDDLAVMPYTSGTTGHPKGCMHTHRSTMVNAVAGSVWWQLGQGWVGLAVLPMFHVTGLQAGLNAPLYNAGTVVLLPRWDRDAAAACVQRYRVTALGLITAMVVDFVSNPRLGEYDLRSLRRIAGGGAAMPRAVAETLEHKMGLKYAEGYGMTETMGATHSNPPDRPKAQCLGVPSFDVDARVVDPVTLEPLADGETGEIVVHGPQVMLGYWMQPDATRAAFVEIEGKRFLRTGDLGRVDEEGYFFFVDRLKRMINVSGYKVWPAEVEALLYQHPAVQEACVIAVRDERRGETVKAVIVLKPAQVGQVTAQEIIDWAHANMAAYKTPRLVQFVDSLPKSGSGKVMWRTLQEHENVAVQAAVNSA